MSTDSLLCRACGCHLEHSDVRQMAVYYRTADASLVAVQYVCPRCGVTEWQRYQAEDWSELAEPAALMPDGEALAAMVEAAQASQPPLGAISVDECIDFGLRIRGVTAADFRALRESVA